MIELIISFIGGVSTGFLALWIYHHKSDVSYNIALIREDLTSLHVRIENLVRMFSLSEPK